MKKSKGFIIFVVGAIWMAILAYSFILGVSKTFKPPPPSRTKTASQLLQNQRERQAELADQQRRLMEDRKQRLRDAQKF